MCQKIIIRHAQKCDAPTLVCTQVVAELPASGTAPRFESFNLWGTVTGPGSKFEDASDMVFHACEAHHDSLLLARDLYCPVKGCTGPPCTSAAAGGGGGSGGGRGRGTKTGIDGRELFADKGVWVRPCVCSRHLLRNRLIDELTRLSADAMCVCVCVFSSLASTVLTW